MAYTADIPDSITIVFCCPEDKNPNYCHENVRSMKLLRISERVCMELLLLIWNEKSTLEVSGSNFASSCLHVRITKKCWIYLLKNPAWKCNFILLLYSTLYYKSNKSRQKNKFIWKTYIRNCQSPPHYESYVSLDKWFNIWIMYSPGDTTSLVRYISGRTNKYSKDISYVSM